MEGTSRASTREANINFLDQLCKDMPICDSRVNTTPILVPIDEPQKVDFKIVLNQKLLHDEQVSILESMNRFNFESPLSNCSQMVPGLDEAIVKFYDHLVDLDLYLENRDEMIEVEKLKIKNSSLRKESEATLDKLNDELANLERKLIHKDLVIDILYT